MSSTRLHGLIAGLAAGVLVLVGLVSMTLIPGGGDVKDSDFTKFYDSSGRRGAALALYAVLVIGCWAMVWFFSELHGRLEGALASAGYRLATIGAASLAIGGAIMLAPAGVQINSAHSAFVGIPIAHAFAQAGLLVAIFGGMYTIGVGVFLLALSARRAGAFPGWFAITSMILAVLLVASYIGIGALLLPVWLILAGIFGFRDTADSAEAATSAAAPSQRGATTSESSPGRSAVAGSKP
jgi:hypothetical protein